MTIIEKAKQILGTEKELTLKELYEQMPEHTPSAIRGNINRYIATAENPEIQRVGKGVYALLEVISCTQLAEDDYRINYTASFFDGVGLLRMYHKDYHSATPVIAPGQYDSFTTFDSYEELASEMKSLVGIFQQGDVREALKRYKSESFDLLVTDPPYRVISGGNKNEAAPKGMLSKNDGKIFANNDISFDEWLPECYRVLKDGTHAYIFTNFLNLEALMQAVQRAGFKLHNLLVWRKNNATPNRWFMKNAEYVILARKGKAKAINDCGSMTVHDFPNIIGNKRHETEKPLELLMHYIANSSKKGEWVLDPFAGSGSTAEAALKLGRKFLTIELDGKYENVIHERLAAALV